MGDIISANVSDILEQFQDAYYKQIGNRMQIGSEEFTDASVYSYVLSLYANLINQTYKNQFIDTAQGMYLDNLASKYNLSRTPDTFSNPYFEGSFAFKKDSAWWGKVIAKGELEITIGDYKYTNYNRIDADTWTYTTALIRFVCNDKHGDVLSASDIKKAVDANLDANGKQILECLEITSMQSTVNEMTDDELRQYIQTNKWRYVSGLASSFESAAMASSNLIADARVRRQGDDDFIIGNVDLYIRPKLNIDDPDLPNCCKVFDIPFVANVIDSLNIATVGQAVNVIEATPKERYADYEFYVPKLYNDPKYVSMYRMKFNACCGYMNNYMLKVNDTFFVSTLVTMMCSDLSQYSTNVSDFGYQDYYDTYYQDEFEKFKALPVIGLKSCSNMVKQDSTPDSYVWYNAEGCDVVLEYI